MDRENTAAAATDPLPVPKVRSSAARASKLRFLKLRCLSRAPENNSEYRRFGLLSDDRRNFEAHRSGYE